jgi:hypothetical protein
MDPATARAPEPANVDQLAINTIRFLSVDAVQKANSGHPERGITPGVEVTTGGHPGRPPYDGASRRRRFVTRQRSPPPGQSRGPAGWRNRQRARQLRKPLQTLMRSERKAAMEHANTMVLTGALIWLVGDAPTKVAVLEPMGPRPTRRGAGRWLSPSLGLGAQQARLQNARCRGSNPASCNGFASLCAHQ